jgi:hypothetical protein
MKHCIIVQISSFIFTLGKERANQHEVKYRQFVCIGAVSNTDAGPHQVTYEERRAKMENRWKQTLGVDNLPASPMEMGVGVVFPNRFSSIARTDSAKPASHFSSAQPNVPVPTQNHQGFSPPVSASRPSAQTSPQGGGSSGRLNGVGASSSGQMC